MFAIGGNFILNQHVKGAIDHPQYTGFNKAKKNGRNLCCFDWANIDSIKGA
jgi:hypothetical protein